MPVSATQSVVGATVGANVVFHGFNGVYYQELIRIGKNYCTK
jgi:phosphate/sulfate permease